MHNAPAASNPSGLAGIQQALHKFFGTEISATKNTVIPSRLDLNC